MKNLLLTVLVLLVMGAAGFAQDSADEVFVFNRVESQLDDSEVDDTYLKSHYMGKDVAVKLQLLHDSYTYQEQGTATSPGTKTVVEKPAIYYSLKKLSKYYKKEIKKGAMTEDEAKAQFSEALNVGLYIRYQQTNEFEQALNSSKDPAQIAYLYSEKVQLEY